MVWKVLNSKRVWGAGFLLSDYFLEVLRFTLY